MTTSAEPEPDRGVLKASLDAIQKVATAIGEHGAPVLAAAAALARLFGFGA